MYALKTHFQKVAAFFAFGNLSANGATFLGWLFTSFAIFTLIYLNGVSSAQIFSERGVSFVLFLLMPLWIFLRFVYNALDGLIARQKGTATFFGEIINENGDVLSDSLLYLSFAKYAWMSSWMMGLVIGAIWFCEFNGIIGKAFPGGVRRYDSFGGGKTERALLLGCLFFSEFLFDLSENWKIGFFLLAGVLSALTGLRRALEAYRFSKGKSYQSYTLYGR